MIGDGRQRRLLQVIVPLELLHCLQNAIGNHRWVGHREGLEPLVVQRLAHYASPDPPSRTRQSLRRVDRQESLDEALALGRELAPVSLREGNGVDLHVLQRERGHGGRQRFVTREPEVGDGAGRPHVAGLAVARASEVVHEHLGSDVVARTDETVHVLRLVDHLRWREGRKGTLLRPKSISFTSSLLGLTKRMFASLGKKDGLQLLEVAVSNVLRLVEIANRVQNLPNDSLCVLLRELAH